MLRPGQILLDKYEIVRLLGEGAFGRVYLAQERLTERKVAIKELREDLPPERAAEARQRFEREIQIGARLDHPRVVKIITHEKQGSEVYLVQEYLPGGSLRTRLNNGPLAVDEAVHIACDIAEALAYLHQHPLDLVHRDISPNNILLDAEGRAKLGDFGVAQSPQHSATRWQGGSEGHPGNAHYRAPEALKAEPLHASADVYMLGAVLWEMLTGRLYCQHCSETPSQWRDDGDIPTELETTLMQALAEDSDARYRTGEEFLNALQQATAAPMKRNQKRNYPVLRQSGTIALASIKPTGVTTDTGHLTRLMRRAPRTITPENVHELRLVRTRQDAREGLPQLAYSPDGRYLAAGYLRKVIIYRASGLAVLMEIPTVSDIKGIAFQDKHILRYVEEDGTLHSSYLPQWHPFRFSRRPPGVVEISGVGAIWSFAASPFGELAIGNANRVLLFHSQSTFSHRRIILERVGPMKCVIYSPKAKLLLVGTGNGSIFLWEKGAIKRLDRPADVPRRSISALSFSPTAEFAAAGDEHGTIRVWGIKQQKAPKKFEVGWDARHMFTLSGVKSRINALTFDPDGTLLAAGYESGTLMIWEIGQTNPVCTLNLDSAIAGVAFSPNGSALALGTASGTVSIWGLPR